jgi:L-seryl-tRNA(Ser) seleniumtransferase
MPTERSRPPSVERLLAAARPLVAEGTDRAALTSVARDVVADERSRLAGDHREREAERKGKTESEGAVVGQVGRSVEALAREVADRLDAFADPPAAGTGLTQVINATGVILHTNLGRAPWARAAIEAATRAAGGYSLLEFDRDAGRRGPRFRAAEEHLIALTGAQDALVTVNNAAALALAVGLAGRRGVAVSRGELVEIGGGVRIPEIVRRTGARLIEVGTTNRTRASDFEAPLVEGRASVVLRVHPSNFAQTGFVEAPDPIELARLSHTHGAILVDDVGSGALLETAAFGLAHEPTPAERLVAGADLVTFSGDKLVGGPQAGLIVGPADLIGRIRRDPLARAVRPDKVTLAALSATLGLYRAGRATTEIPVWQMIAATIESLGRRADAVFEALPAEARSRIVVSETMSAVGGGSLPGEMLESVGLVVAGRGAGALAARLRGGDPVVVGRVEHGAVVLDLRTVDPSDDVALARALVQALAGRAAVGSTGDPT